MFFQTWKSKVQLESLIKGEEKKQNKNHNINRNIFAKAVSEGLKISSFFFNLNKEQSE